MNHKRTQLIAFSLILLGAFSLLNPSSAGNVPKTEVDKLISEYKKSEPETLVHAWMRQMPAPNIKNVAFRKEILDNLPSQVTKLRINDKNLEEAVTQVLGPVLALYNRSRVYEIIVVRHPVPMAMSDSGVALVITTGLLQRISSDDELLGIVAHELGHEYYTKRSYVLRQKQKSLSAIADSTVPMNQVLAELSRVELDCDAFSAMTLATIGRNPAEFAKHLLAVERDYDHQTQGGHPDAHVRAKLITGIVSDKVLSIRPQKTQQLRAMKTLLTQ